MGERRVVHASLARENSRGVFGAVDLVLRPGRRAPSNPRDAPACLTYSCIRRACVNTPIVVYLTRCECARAQSGDWRATITSPRLVKVIRLRSSRPIIVARLLRPSFRLSFVSREICARIIPDLLFFGMRFRMHRVCVNLCLFFFLYIGVCTRG